MNLKRLSSVSLGHFAIDVLNSSIAMILAHVAGPFDLSNGQIGLGVMAYQMVGSLSQPYFGWLADRFSGRWIGAAGLLWTAVFYTLGTYAETYGMLLFLMSLAALGSGAFHPQGAMVASDAGNRKASSATAIFFLLGQIGLAVGPIIVGIILEYIGLAGGRYLAVASLPIVALMVLGLWRPVQPIPETNPSDSTDRSANTSTMGSRRRRVLVAFGVLVALRATVQQAYYGLLPKFFEDQGIKSSEYGVLVGIFSFALAVGTLAGGILGDRLDSRRLLIWTLLLTTPFTYLMLVTDGWAYAGLALIAGFLVGVPHSILIVMAQKLLPRRQGLASGAVLGFMFATGAAGTGLVGWIADYTGLALSLQGVALLPLGAGASAFFLSKRRRQQGEPVASTAVGAN